MSLRTKTTILELFQLVMGAIAALCSVSIYADAIDPLTNLTRADSLREVAGFDTQQLYMLISLACIAAVVISQAIGRRQERASLVEVMRPYADLAIRLAHVEANLQNMVNSINQLATVWQSKPCAALPPTHQHHRATDTASEHHHQRRDDKVS